MLHTEASNVHIRQLLGCSIQDDQSKKLILVELAGAKIYSEMFLRYKSWCRLGYVNRKASQHSQTDQCAQSKYIQQSGSIFGAETFRSPPHLISIHKVSAVLKCT